MNESALVRQEKKIAILRKVPYSFILAISDIYMNKNVNVRLFKTTNLLKFSLIALKF